MLRGVIPSINVCYAVVSSSTMASVLMSNILTCAPMWLSRIAERVAQTALLYCLIHLHVISVRRHPPHTVCQMLSGVLLSSGTVGETPPRVCRLITLKYRVCLVSGGIRIRSGASVIFCVKSSSQYFLWQSSCRTGLKCEQQGESCYCSYPGSVDKLTPNRLGVSLSTEPGYEQ